MKPRFAVFALALLILVSVQTGCGDPGVSGDDKVVITPEKRAELAKQAGNAAVLAWLSIEKPEKAQVEAVKVIVDKLRENLTAYKEGGFKAALPGINEGIDKLFPKEEDKGRLLAAKKLAETMVAELDRLFEKHPDWKDLGGEVAGLVGSFCDGSSESLELYLK